MNRTITGLAQEHISVTKGSKESPAQVHKQSLNLCGTISLSLYLSLCVCAGKTGDQSASQGEGAHINGLQSEELSQLREELEDLRRQHAQLQTQLAEKDTLIGSLVCVCVCVFTYVLCSTFLHVCSCW